MDLYKLITKFLNYSACFKLFSLLKTVYFKEMEIPDRETLPLRFIYFWKKLVLFFRKWRIQFIESDSKNFYIVTKHF